ncbi:MAG: group II intron reverse transcriptase/maturase [Acidobacteriaceae bacterium]
MNHTIRPVGKGDSHTAHMHAFEESDSGAVPMNHLNKDEKSLAESEEGRPLIKENTHQLSTHSTQSEARVSQGLAGVRQAAKESKGMQFTALLHHLTVGLLREGFHALKRKAAPGVDGVTWEEYESGLEERLVNLHSRVHRGAYRAQPSRRVYIPKADGRLRPLGVAALEDKIVQHAVVAILNQIYEEDFRGFSYGFRPGRSQHQALDALYVALTRKKVSFVLDADIRGFFDNLDRGWMLKFLQHRVTDPRMLRLIQKWLDAGVMEEGEWKDTGMGTPQGSVISPILANIYLHYVFDLWVDAWRKKNARGDVVVVRYADDNVLGFQYRAEADRFLEEFRERLGKFGLELNPDKTRRIEFGRFAEQDRKRRGEEKPATFDFLGFTHISGKDRNGNFAVKRHTIGKRLREKLAEIKQQLRQRMHEPVVATGKWLRSVVQGYFNYHAVPGNSDCLRIFRYRVTRLWRQVLIRRSQRGRLNWERMRRLEERWIPTPRILHPYPRVRFDAIHPR